MRELGLEDLPTIALAKQEEEIFLAGRSESVILPRRSEALKLLQRIRNEAHRFAVAYHRKRRTARTLVSDIQSIPGIGPKRAQTLLSHFRSLERIRAAGPDEIARVPGFTRARAARLLDQLREQEGPGAGLDGMGRTMVRRTRRSSGLPGAAARSEQPLGDRDEESGVDSAAGR
jgi:excinuclease ABC subunit C